MDGKIKLLWRVLLVMRFALVLIPQTGYIHPDEFFQGPEIVAGGVFNFTVWSSWEFKTSSPIRSVVSAVLTSGPAYLFLCLIRYWCFGVVITPYLLLILPRIVMTVASLIHDWCLYHLCTKKVKDPYVPLSVFGSSYVCLVFYTRTFNNNLESILFSALLCVIGCDLTLFPEKAKQGKKDFVKTITNPMKNSKIISILLTCGFFIRPTFILFSLCPVLFWITSKITSRNQKWNFLYTLNSLILSSLPTAIVLITLDTLYYDRSVFSSIIEYDIPTVVKNAVVTPLNFLRYNIESSNLKQHGLHPHYLHLVVNVQLLYGILGIIGFTCCAKMVYQCISKRELILFDRIDFMMTLSWIFPILLLSLFPHQEPRFLIPLLFPLSYLYSKLIYDRTLLLVVWVVMNISLLIFFGFVHQAGLVPCLLHLSETIPRSTNFRTNVVFYHTYMPPMHLLKIQKDEKITVVDLRGQKIHALIFTLHNLTPTTSRSVFLVAPACEEASIALATEGKYKLETLKTFFPHFSSEELPKNFVELSTTVELKKQFTLCLYRIHTAV